MFEAYTLEEIKLKLEAEMDEYWFVSYFELTIEDLIKAFEDLIDEKKDEIALDLGYIKRVENYDDREN